ncbi:helix-turn-helix transcriptional regulator [Martelella alba]|uniref:Helix-turn-helix transcriptional regulator n=1 Tax=Martelella alba TaxID=2590451 RepID=A0A506U150_9HYPH|nr:AraC family transcriptional regulator [Martelella alba]TPW26951.1 helix-turn-helix transcriptional regulator [Martelella alba]
MTYPDTLLTPLVTGEAIFADPASTGVAKLVDQALLLNGNDRGKALTCLNQAQQIMAKSPDEEADTKPAEPSVAVAARGGLAPWQVSKVRRHIEENIDETITLVNLASLLGLSVSYFSAVFKVSFGVSPHAFIIARRVEKAKKSIALTDAPLSEIALDCGLSDQAHLSRIFRRHTGVTPTAWRRASAGKGAGRLFQMSAGM